MKELLHFRAQKSKYSKCSDRKSIETDAQETLEVEN